MTPNSKQQQLTASKESLKKDVGTVGRKKEIAAFVEETKSDKSSTKSENMQVPASAIEIDMDIDDIIRDQQRELFEEISDLKRMLAMKGRYLEESNMINILRYQPFHPVASGSGHRKTHGPHNFPFSGGHSLSQKSSDINLGFQQDRRSSIKHEGLMSFGQKKLNETPAGSMTVKGFGGGNSVILEDDELDFSPKVGGAPSTHNSRFAGGATPAGSPGKIMKAAGLVDEVYKGRTYLRELEKQKAVD